MKELKKAQMGMIAILALMLVSITRRLPETRKLSSGITTLALAGIVLLVAAGTVSADTEITEAMLPYTTTTDGERYFLTGDLTCADTTTSAITIANNNVIIDGQGNKITGTVSGTDCAPWDTSQTYPAPHCGVANIADKDNVVIKNLELENFCTGIALGKRPGAGSVDNNTVTGCKIHDCGKSTVVTHGIQMVWTNNCSITNNEIYEIDGTGIAGGCSGGGNGIFLFGDLGPERGWYNIITCNNLHHNVKSGFFTKHQCMHNTISYNLATYNTQSGIMPKCEKSNYNEFEYNNMSYNGVNGFYLGGDGNTIRYNTMLNNGAEGLGLKDTADSNTITNNTACGNGGTGDMAWTDVTNIGDSNTCDSGPAGACDWSCGTLDQVYFDFDEDAHYSSASCTCDNTLCLGACCNPGLFNESHASMLNGTNPAICWLTAGDDPNDCLAYTATGDLFESDGTTQLMDADVTMKNRKTGKQWAATVDGNTYTVKIDPVLDISAGDMLRITAKNSSDAEGWTDHKVHTCDIAAEGFDDANVIVGNYILNYYPCYPYYVQEEDNWSGPAVMKACIAHYNETDGVPIPSQAELNETGIGNNHGNHAGLLYVDPRGMEKTMDQYLHPYNHNYAVFALNMNDALHRICYWQKLGPGAVPAYEDYSNWMAIRGIRTSKVPSDYSPPYEYDVYGFWVNDPNSIGIGENTYKTAANFTADYYKPTVDPEVPNWDGKYISVLEPPEHDAEVRIVPARPRFADAIEPVMMEKILKVDGIERVALVEVVEDDDSLKVVKAAIDGVTEELIPYDTEFASVFAEIVAGEPILVAGDNDYYIVPFDLPVKERPMPIKKPVEIQKLDKDNNAKLLKKIDQDIVIEPIPIEPIHIDEEKTLVVVLVDADDGSFKEASWVADPVKYLPVSDSEALKLVFDEAGISTTKPVIELVYRGSSPYYPDWKITIGDDVYFVGQDGTVSQE